MILPENAMVKNFEEVELGGLIVGRFTESGPNFFAIRARQADMDLFVSLTPGDDHQPLPYILDPYSPPKVLDLGTKWEIDVTVDRNFPVFQIQDRTEVLIRSKDKYYLRMKEGLFLDLKSGIILGNIERTQNLCLWKNFSIIMNESIDSKNTVEVFKYPVSD
tara:strand:+ start:128 stop:613 length:486 start_codon:yes stop_codon:yes gene_type:complete